MFDENTKEPEDIFADDTDISSVAPVMQPSSPNQSQKPVPAEAPVYEDVVTSGPSRTLVILIVLVVVLLLGVVAVFAYTWMSRQSSANTTIPANSVTTQIPTNNQTTTPLPIVPLAEQTPEPTITPIDTDKDGLLDDEEATFGTNPTLVDSDDDDLSDADEVKVWGTDPLDSDSDNDGFPDGTEVKSGYDPKVAGARLLNLPQSETSSNL